MTMRIPGLELSTLGLVLVLTACDTTMGPTPMPRTVQAELNVPFTLATGQTAVFAQENLSVKFGGVLDDWRCPIDMVCMSAGDATMAVQALQDGKAPEVLSLTLFGVDGPQEVVYEGFGIHAQQLMPNRRSDRAIRASEYRVTLLVDHP